MASAIVATCAMGTTSQHVWAEEPIAYTQAELFLEQNNTDGDLGLHFNIDGEGWRRPRLKGPNPNGNKQKELLNILVRGKLGNVIGLTQLRCESAEPPFDELPRDEFLSLFPEGEYTFFGKTVDRIRMKSMTTLTHIMPGEVELVSPEEDGEVPADEDLVIEWATLDDPAPPENLIEFYEVVVEKDQDGEFHRVFSVHMLPTDSTLRCPAEFLEAGKDYKVEIIAQETSGNRSSIEVPFVTEE